MSLTSDIRTAASNFAGLTALLGTTPFRWFSVQKPQSAGLPCVVVQIISQLPTYVATGRLHTGWSRLQFTVWSATPGGASGEAVETQLLLFLDQLNLIGIPNLSQYPAQVVLRRDGLYPQTDPPIWQKIVDAMIFANDKL